MQAYWSTIKRRITNYYTKFSSFNIQEHGLLDGKEATEDETNNGWK